jgi:hypothetical protein
MVERKTLFESVPSDPATLRQSIERLEFLITQNESNENFVVYGLEPGAKKSFLTDQIIAKNYETAYSRTFLIAKKFKTAVQESVNRINEQSHHVIATGITSDNWGEFQGSLSILPHIPVIVITHERYLNLSLNPEIQSFFEHNRHTLIIDEFLAPPTITFSEYEHNKIINYLQSRTLRNELDNLCDSFFSEVTFRRGDKSKIIACSPSIDIERLSEFKKKVSANRNAIMFPNLVMEYLDGLKTLSRCHCYHYGGRITAYDERIKLWGLKNNIVLDANAGIDKRYNCSPVMILDVQPKINDFSNSKIRIVSLNSSKAGKKLIVDYHEKIAQAIRLCKSNDDKTLIVCHKEEENELLIPQLIQQGFSVGIGDAYDGEDLAVAHFGDILGKNQWRDFNQVWCIATPNLTIEAYVLFRDFFLNIGRREDEISTCRKQGGYGFHDEELEDIRIGYLVGEIYQAVRRIDRNNQHGSEIYLVTKSQRVIDDLIRQLPGIQTGDPIDLGVEFNNENASNKVTDEKARQLADLLLSLPTNDYTKKFLREQLGWKDASNFHIYFNHKFVQDLVTEGIIESVNARTIRRLPCREGLVAK